MLPYVASFQGHIGSKLKKSYTRVLYPQRRLHRHLLSADAYLLIKEGSMHLSNNLAHHLLSNLLCCIPDVCRRISGACLQTCSNIASLEPGIQQSRSKGNVQSQRGCTRCTHLQGWRYTSLQCIESTATLPTVVRKQACLLHMLVALACSYYLCQDCNNWQELPRKLQVCLSYSTQQVSNCELLCCQLL